MRYSPLMGRLQSAFHALSGRRVQARFGVWTDRPDLNLTLRHDYEKAKAHEARSLTPTVLLTQVLLLAYER
jgi:hypothetical protein